MYNPHNIFKLCLMNPSFCLLGFQLLYAIISSAVYKWSSFHLICQSFELPVFAFPQFSLYESIFWLSCFIKNSNPQKCWFLRKSRLLKNIEKQISESQLHYYRRNCYYFVYMYCFWMGPKFHVVWLCSIDWIRIVPQIFK